MLGKLVLSDGTVLEGESFGAEGSSSGEVVFNTGMVGYPETFTDPSYFGQILILTYPLVGNYGVPKKEFFESQKIQIKGLIVQNYIDKYSHYLAKRSLADWLKAEKIPALQRIDTRALTSKLRHHGVMLGQITMNHEPMSEAPTNVVTNKQSSSSNNQIYDPNAENIMPYVSAQEVQTYGEGKKNIVLIDCGAKENIVRSLVKRKVRVTRVPWDFNPLKENLNFDGVLISNGPGDPKMARETIETIRQLMDEGIPTCGICLGNQLLALAAGGDTYKLKFGHRSQNQPVLDKISGKAIVTSQNHGFAVDPGKLSSDWVEWFVNLNDGTNEGIRHKKKPFLSSQFHPEATPGPVEAQYIFDEFISLL